MMIFNFACGLIRRFNASRQHSDALRRLCAANPGCVIKSPDIYDTRLGKNVAVFDRTILNQVCLGSFSYVSNDSTLINAEVGNFCSIGPHVQIGLGVHPSRIFVSTYPAFYSSNTAGCPVAFREDKIFDDSIPRTIIDNDVWIAANVIIPGGIHVGTGAIVAAGAVVVKDVPPYAVVGGNPATIIRYRFSEEQIQDLLKSEWWHWPVEKIRQHIGDFSDIEKFQARRDVHD